MEGLIPRQIHVADEFTSIVEIEGVALGTPEIAEIPHPHILVPDERVKWREAARTRNRTCIRKARHLPTIIDELAKRIGAAQGTEVFHRSVLPQKRSGLCSAEKGILIWDGICSDP